MKKNSRLDGARGKSGQRRTQAERREATRRRLVEATTTCLARNGYAGTTISRIVKEAKVSHGASGHYFPTKGALIQAAAEELMRDAYRRWGDALLSAKAADDRLEALLNAAWRDVFDIERSDAFLELMVAGKHDPELLARLKPFAVAGVDIFRKSANHFFAGRQQGIEPYDMMMLTQWLFRGMAMDQRLAESPADFEPFLRLWLRIMGEYVVSRPDVTDPPPAPDWRE